jgi:hypothetical protein
MILLDKRLLSFTRLQLHLKILSLNIRSKGYAAPFVFSFAGKKRQECISGLFFHVFSCLVMITPHTPELKICSKKNNQKKSKSPELGE